MGIIGNCFYRFSQRLQFHLGMVHSMNPCVIWTVCKSRRNYHSLPCAQHAKRIFCDTCGHSWSCISQTEGVLLAKDAGNDHRSYLRIIGLFLLNSDGLLWNDLFFLYLAMNAHSFLQYLKPRKIMDESFLAISQGNQFIQRWFELSWCVIFSIKVK